MRQRENHNQRRRRKEKEVKVKIGHGGTLDPLATGVLIAGVGKGTKSLQDFLLCTKQYETVVLFGASTDTYDRVGKVLRRAPYEHVTKDLVENALGQFRGKFMQLPPLFSALKMNGKPLYEYAREGKPIPREIERRPVEVLELELVEWMEPGTHPHKAPAENASHAEINVANQLWSQEKVLPAGTTPKKEETEEEKREDFENRKRKLSEDQDELVLERPASKHRKPDSQDAVMSGGLGPSSEGSPTADLSIHTPPPSSAPQETEKPGPPAARIRMTVTSGFYVRSLAHDLGAAVGSAALMAELERSRQGEFELGKNVLEYSDLAKGEEVWGPQVERMIDEWNGKKAPAAEKQEVKSKEPKEKAAPVKDERTKEEPMSKEETSEPIKAEVKEEPAEEKVSEPAKAAV
jgi:tRNA pseudouridine55 synthase